MKDTTSYERYVLGLYGAMLSDIAYRCPELRVDCERDNKRLLSAIEHRGIHFFLVDLPAFGKHFDLCLSKECLTRSGVALMRPYKKRVVIPRLFKGLLLRIFDDNGVLRSDLDHQSVRDVRQLCYAVKRLRLACDDSSTWEHVNEFFKIDGEVILGSLNWSRGDFGSDGSRDLQFGDHVPSRPETELPLGCSESTDPPRLDAEWYASLQWVADIICSEFGRFNPSEWDPRHGPGAVSDLRVDRAFKYDFPFWPEKLDLVFPYADYGFSSYQHWADKVSSGEVPASLRHEPPSKLIAVPKEFTKPRLIAAEPDAHQWCQQIVRDYLTTRIEHSSLKYSVHLRDQTFNQNAAKRASLDGSLSTIDLSSASDRISCWVIERLFRNRPELLDALYACRTRWIKQDIDRKSPQFYELRKFSTQGSACTFPVQSILFAVLSIGTCLYVRGRPVSIRTIKQIAQEVLVFGDDIIVPTDCADAVVECLHHFRLKVNPAKTFTTGRFRESCGYDAFMGTDVTKISIMSPPSVSKPESVLSSVDVHNNLLRAGWYNTAAYVKRTVDSLRRFSFKWVADLSGAIGWLSLFGESNGHLRHRWNPYLQRREVLCTLPCGSPQRSPVDSNAMVLQYFIEGKPFPETSDRLGRAPLRHALKLRRVWAPLETASGGRSLRWALLGSE